MTATDELTSLVIFSFSQIEGLELFHKLEEDRQY